MVQVPPELDSDPVLAADFLISEIMTARLLRCDPDGDMNGKEGYCRYIRINDYSK